MPRIAYKKGRPGPERLEQIERANEIIAEYAADGYQLTLRQLYYQFVARDLIENSVRAYKRLGDAINEGRLLGLIDWAAIEDRTRNLSSLATWPGPAEIVQACSKQFRGDIWETQPVRFEVWVEKEALAGVVERTCHRLRIPYFACRGYVSQSEMWEAGRRLATWVDQHLQHVVVLHLGDHDPSGIDMSRDIEARLELFMGRNASESLTFERIALNMDQIEQYDLPPNPAKLTDSRATAYVERFGDESWELDALSPSVIDQLITAAVEPFIERDEWLAFEAREMHDRKGLTAVSRNWDRVQAHLKSETAA